MAFSPFINALRRARFPILSMAATYMISALAGAVMAHSGSRLALSYRDRLVSHAMASDPAARAEQLGHRLRAALWDSAENAVLGAAPVTLAGLSVALPYPMAAFRGWVGGIVSVNGDHRSRLANPAERDYYLAALLLQLLPYSLTGGAGVYLGLSWFREWRRPENRHRWLVSIPRLALSDALLIYLLSLPLFLAASLFEFLAR